MKTLMTKIGKSLKTIGKVGTGLYLASRLIGCSPEAPVQDYNWYQFSNFNEIENFMNKEHGGLKTFGYNIDMDGDGEGEYIFEGKDNKTYHTSSSIQKHIYGFRIYELGKFAWKFEPEIGMCPNKIEDKTNN